MTVLVTGGSGHVGTHITARFAKEGEKVVAYDLFPPRPNDYLDAGTRCEDYVTFVKGDITDLPLLLRTMEERGVDRVIHTAAVMNEFDARANPVETVKVNVSGTQTVLEAARLRKLRRTVCVSTGGIFGRRTDLAAIRETDSPSPVGVYAKTKYMGELLVEAYRDFYAVDCAVVRLAWVYGPGIIAPDMVATRGPIPTMLYKAIKGQKLEEESGGDFLANYTYVKDVANGIYLVTTAHKLTYGVYNISSGKLYSLNEVVNAIKKIIPNAQLAMGQGAGEFAKDTPIRGPLSIDRVASELGYRVQYPLELACQDYINWLRKHT